MIEVLRQWFISMTCTALLLALADSLCPPGPVRKIGKMVGGLVLLIVMLSPLCTLDSGILTTALMQQADWLDWEEENEVSQEWMKTIIGEKTGAYILDKATELGISCEQVIVTCQMGEEVPYPSAVTIVGNLDDQQRSALSQVIERDLAIGADCQSYQEGEGR